MDCEKFDRVVIDLLYDELDELTRAAARRHMEHCMRCRSIGSELRATREVGMLPLVEAPEGLALRILEAERQATQLLPLSKRLGRGLSLLAGYAMRPQLSMAALLMLMIGSSLFFLRAQPGDREHVRVTERGVPESDNDSVAVVAKRLDPPEQTKGATRQTPTPSPSVKVEDSAPHRDHAFEAKEARPQSPSRDVASAPSRLEARGGAALGASSEEKELEGSGLAVDDSDASFDAAMSAYRDGRYSDAERRFDEIAKQGGTHAANAALYEAQALRRISGCPNAAPHFEAVHSRYPGSVGNDAAWQAADCYRSLGDLARARQNYELLAADPSYKTRAKEAIAELDQRVLDQEALARKAAAKAKAAATLAPAAAKPAAPPATAP